MKEPELTVEEAMKAAELASLASIKAMREANELKTEASINAWRRAVADAQVALGWAWEALRRERSK